MQAFGILAFVVALLASVMIHEAGHFLTARAFGMKATQFFFGFGPTLFSRTKGETEYGAKAIPVGGFVKIVGMTPTEEVEPGDEGRAFYRFPARKKVVVLAAGAFMNFVLAVLLVFAAVFAVGQPDEKAPVLGAPAECLALVISPDAKPLPAKKQDGKCVPGTVPGIAAQAGVQRGDRVVAANGKPIADYKEFQKLVRASAGRPLEVVVERDGTRRTLRMTPVLTTRPSLDQGKKTPEQVGAIGIIQQPPLKRVGPVAATKQTGTYLKYLATATVETLTKKLDSITTVYGEDRDPAGFVGPVGAGRISGEVFEQPETFGVRLGKFLVMMAGLNMILGVFNLLPLLPLDGGHIAVAVFESVRHKLRRLRGYAGEIRRVDYDRLMPLTLAVVVVFIGFTVWLLGADIVNPVRLPQ